LTWGCTAGFQYNSVYWKELKKTKKMSSNRLEMAHGDQMKATFEIWEDIVFNSQNLKIR
jgi:hypothetical protein